MNQKGIIYPTSTVEGKVAEREIYMKITMLSFQSCVKCLRGIVTQLSPRKWKGHMWMTCLLSMTGIRYIIS